MQTKNYKKYHWNITGNYEVTKWVKDFLSSNDINCSQTTCKHVFRNLVSGNRQIERLCKFLYKDSILRIPRKYEKYLELNKWNKGRKVYGC